MWAAQEIEQLLHFLNEEDRWYEKFDKHDTPYQDLANGGGKCFLGRVEGLSAADLLKEVGATRHWSSINFFSTKSYILHAI